MNRTSFYVGTRKFVISWWSLWRATRQSSLVWNRVFGEWVSTALRQNFLIVLDKEFFSNVFFVVQNEWIEITGCKKERESFLPVFTSCEVVNRKSMKIQGEIKLRNLLLPQEHEPLFVASALFAQDAPDRWSSSRGKQHTCAIDCIKIHFSFSSWKTTPQMGARGPWDTSLID